MYKRGIFTISIDVEMAWGTFDHNGHVKLAGAYEKYRYIISKILKLFNKYEISATWAVVGHLFLDSCHKKNGRLHPDIVRPRYRWFRDDWFRDDPGTNIGVDKFWYGSDIVNEIKLAWPPQEIASHSFSHIIFQDKGCTKEVADSDIRKCVELAKKENIKLQSFVFPRNLPGHLEILSRYGFKVFRGRDDVYSRLSLRPKIIKKLYFLFGDLIGSTPPVVMPNTITVNGNKLIEIPSSMLFRFASGVSRIIPAGVRLKKARKGIDAAIRKNKIFHLWFHPISFAWKSKEMFGELEKILEYVYQKKKERVLENLTLLEAGKTYLSFLNEKDKFNPGAVLLHNIRNEIFRNNYSENLSRYHLNAFQYGRKKILTELLKFFRNLEIDSRILDAGCGTGYHLNLMKGLGFTRCTGVDLSWRMLTQSKNLYPEIPVEMVDARRLCFPDNCFDAVISIEVLRYFFNRDLLLKEIYRVTKPGGRVFITAAPLFSANLYGLYNSLCSALNLNSYISCAQSFETVTSLKKRIEGAGFDRIDIKGYFFGPYFLLDKFIPRLSSLLMRRLERLDDLLAKNNFLRNLSNHLVVVARKPDK
jgi:ubiquinone/menaquinone biosynthesis C-methylase UbiE